MPSCIVKNCKNRSSQKSFKQEVLEEKVKISFHRLPKKDHKRNLWMKQLGLKQSDLHNDTVVCSIHFKTEDFDKSSLSRIRLQPDAVPFIQAPEEGIELQNAELLHDHSYSRLHQKRDLNDNPDARYSKQNINDETDAEYSEQNIYDNLNAERSKQDLRDDSDAQYLQEVPNVERLLQDNNIKDDLDPKQLLAKVDTSTSECIFSDNDKGVQVNVSREDKATCISPERLFHTPEKDQLREHLARVKKDYQNQLRVLKQKCKRSNKRIEDLKAIVRFNKEQFIRSRTNL